MHAFAPPAPDAAPIWFASAENWDEGSRSSIGEPGATFAERCGFKPRAGRFLILPGAGGAICVLFGVDAANAPCRDPLAPGKLATLLPEGVYRFVNPPADAELAALGFLLGLYRYDRFKPDPAPKPRLVAPEDVDAGRRRNRRRGRLWP